MMNRKKREGIVYSTNPDFNFREDAPGIPETLAPSRQQLYVWLDSKSRKGKTVTLVKGFVGKEDDMQKLARELKTLCGTGGSLKDSEILIQGNFREKIVTYLEKNGYKVKKAGG
jgi:translation initiation factor 1